MSSKPLDNETFSHQKLTLYKIKKDQGTALTNKQSGRGLFCFPWSNLIISLLVVLLAKWVFFLLFFGIQTCKFLVYNLLYYLSGYLSIIPSPKHSKCIKPLQYLCWPCFLVSFWGFFGLNSTFCWLGRQFQIGQDCFN